MKMFSILVALHLMLAGTGFAQHFNFMLPDKNSKFDIRSDSGRITCLFPISLKNVEPSVFRKVFLDENLHFTEFSNYQIPGKAHLVATETNEKYTIHAFQSKSDQGEAIHFIVTAKSGKIYSTFIKTAADFAPLFTSEVRKTSRIRINFIENKGNPDVVIVEPVLKGGYPMEHGKITAIRVDDGRNLWTWKAPHLWKVISTENELIGISEGVDGGKAPLYTLHFFDKENGRPIRSKSLLGGDGPRDVSVLASNGQEIMVAGTEYPLGKQKHGHFFMSMFDLSGKSIFDQADTTDRMSSQRMHTLGYVFDLEGNLLIIGEGWKLDYSRAIAGTAISILFTAALGVPMIPQTGVDQHITSLIIAKISPTDGIVKDFFAFPIGPWFQFSQLITDGVHIFIANSSEVLSYNPDQPNLAPSNFVNFHYREQLIIGPDGPVAIKVKKKNVELEMLPFLH